jgi:hypothetical protein
LLAKRARSLQWDHSIIRVAAEWGSLRGEAEARGKAADSEGHIACLRNAMMDA